MGPLRRRTRPDAAQLLLLLVLVFLHAATAQTPAATAEPAPAPVHDPFADGHLDSADNDECDKCESHRVLGVVLVTLAIGLFALGVVGLLRGGHRAARNSGRMNDIQNPMLRMSTAVTGGDAEDPTGSLYTTWTPDASRAEGSAGDGRANRYMTAELRAQVPDKPAVPGRCTKPCLHVPEMFLKRLLMRTDDLASAAGKMKEQGNQASTNSPLQNSDLIFPLTGCVCFQMYQEALALVKGSESRSSLILAATEVYELSLTKLGDADDPSRDRAQVRFKYKIHRFQCKIHDF